jgi:hypothetical protein
MELRATAMEAEGYGDEIAALPRHRSFLYVACQRGLIFNKIERMLFLRHRRILMRQIKKQEEASGEDRPIQKFDFENSGHRCDQSTVSAPRCL